MTAKQIFESENAELRSQLEAKQAGCTAKVAKPSAAATLDELLHEQCSLIGVRNGVAAAARVEERGAGLLAKLPPAPPATPKASAEDDEPPTPPKGLTATDRCRAAGSPEVSALRTRIGELESALASCKTPLTRKCLETNLASAKAKLAELTK